MREVPFPSPRAVDWERWEEATYTEIGDASWEPRRS